MAKDLINHACNEASIQYQYKKSIFYTRNYGLKINFRKWYHMHDIKKKNIFRNIFNKRNARLINWKHKMLLKNFKEDLNKWKSHVHGLKENIIQMTIFPNWSTDQCTTYQNPTWLLHRKWQHGSKFKGSRIDKTISERIILYILYFPISKLTIKWQ